MGPGFSQERKRRIKMMLYHKSQELLQDAVPSSRLFADWLTGALEADFPGPARLDAGLELEVVLKGAPSALENTSDPAPLFLSAWVSGWAEGMKADLPGEEDRTLFHAQLAALQAGEADVVVTGQQPAYLGGPLYTLYKVATTIALARKRSSAGRPTVPVFWSGDDDDDLAEALGPVAWDPAAGVIHRSPEPPAGSRPVERSRMLGRLAADPWSASAARWLDQVSAGNHVQTDPLPAELAAIWRDAVADGWSWSRLVRRTLLRVFTGCGLMVVSGDDSGLHETAGPLYERILARFDVLTELAAQRGRDLVDRGWHAQINARSLAQPLFTVAGDRRKAYLPGNTTPDPSLLRPGVMLRSPVQDWLLRPAAVVVGPGELAYLRQLDPLYGELDIPRPPLVPRLFAWLAPAGFDPGALRDFRERSTTDPALAARLADEAGENVRRILADILTRELGVDKDRAASLSGGRARRWRKGVAAMLKAEIQRSRRQKDTSSPAWVFPDGMRQERHLAYLCATALWGGDLVAACLEAAALHLECGSRSRWREFVIEVPEP